MASYPQLFLRPSKAGVLESGHPWLLGKSIIEPTVPLDAGAVVDLSLPDGRFLARGVYNPASHIRVRVYQWQQSEPLDASWLINRLDHAWLLRAQLIAANPGLSSLRLVNSEGDGLSGLIVDRFAEYVVVQITALAMRNWLTTITNWIADRFQPHGILLRVDDRIAAAENMPADESVLFGSAPAQTIVLEEHGIKIQIDLITGQKTGYYLDQRDNRLHAARWIAGGRMLDVCCYLGGFSLSAMKWGSPTSVLAIDSSKRAIEQAQQNSQLNGFDKIEFAVGDCFEQLQILVDRGERFQSIVLDPPRMAGSRQQKDNALRAYHKLNSLAVRLLVPGGILITCSCSGRVSREEFTKMLHGVSQRTGRHLQILEQRGAAPDHPVNIACPESEYLKCIVCRIN